MTTATGDFSIDWSLAGDVNPYTNVDFDVIGTALQTKVVVGAVPGRLVSAFGTSGFRYNGTISNATIRAKIETSTDYNDGGDDIGPALLKADGSGYYLKVFYDNFEIWELSNITTGARIGAATRVNYDLGDIVELQINTSTGDITSYRNGVLVETVNDTTYSTGISPSVYSKWLNQGKEGAVSFAADGVSAPLSITSPDTTTEGTATVAGGTLLDTVTTFSLTSGTHSIAQTIDSATTTTLNYVAESGVNQCAPGVPVSGVPLEPTISAVGITPYVVQQKADDGVNPPATRNITLNGEATHEVVQVMIATSNVTEGESVLAPSIIDVEDNMQYYAPKVVDTVNITWNADGTFTTDKDQTVTFNLPYFSPLTGQHSCISLTVRDTSIIAVGNVIFEPVAFEAVGFTKVEFEGV